MLTLLVSSRKLGDGSTEQAVPFTRSTREGNLPSSVLQVKSGYDGIVVNNTLAVPLLIDATLNCSIRTHQNFASCYLSVYRDDKAVGQTPFITPDTYDQQSSIQPFILNPGEKATLTYTFAIGSKNKWFQTHFGFYDDEDTPKMCLEPNTDDLKNQQSYFYVKATSIVGESDE